jgi:hypothetical protein
MDGAESAGAEVKILDPLSVSVWHEPDCELVRFIGGALPQNRTGSFLDDSIYREHLATNRLYLELDLVLGIKMPIGLGGQMKLDNFQVENIYNYFESTAPIYKKALAAKKPGRRGRPK